MITKKYDRKRKPAEKTFDLHFDTLPPTIQVVKIGIAAHVWECAKAGIPYSL